MGPVICKNRHFQVTIKIIICQVLQGHLRHLQGMITLNANRHLARFVTFEAAICEVLHRIKLLHLPDRPIPAEQCMILGESDDEGCFEDTV